MLLFLLFFSKVVSSLFDGVSVGFVIFLVLMFIVCV